MSSQHGGGLRAFLGIPTPQSMFAGTLDGLPRGTKVRQSRADATDPVVSSGILLYAVSLVVALFAQAWGMAVVVVGGLLLGGFHALAESGGPTWRLIRLMALPALAASLVVWAGDAPFAVLTLLLPPIAGYLAMPAVQSVQRARQSPLAATASPRWLRRATDNGRAVAIIRKYPQDRHGEELRTRDRDGLAAHGYRLADELRTGDPKANLFLVLLDTILFFTSEGSWGIGGQRQAWIYTLFVKHGS